MFAFKLANRIFLLETVGLSELVQTKELLASFLLLLGRLDRDMLVEHKCGRLRGRLYLSVPVARFLR